MNCQFICFSESNMPKDACEIRNLAGPDGRIRLTALAKAAG